MSTTSSPDLLLDTHVWYWYQQGLADELKPSVLRHLEEADRAGRLAISVVTFRELGLLVARGRLRLAMPFAVWVHRALESSGVTVLEVDAETALLSVDLPGAPPRDPWDQLIIATALRRGLRLVTRDRAILEVAARGHVRTLDAGRGRVVGEAARRTYHARRGR